MWFPVVAGIGAIAGLLFCGWLYFGMRDDKPHDDGVRRLE